MANDEIRLPLLMRLAEQAMSDAAFRAVAAEDLDRALADYGYDLNAGEQVLVGRFRAALEEAGIDLFLKDESDLGAIFGRDDLGEIEQLLDEMGQ